MNTVRDQHSQPASTSSPELYTIVDNSTAVIVCHAASGSVSKGSVYKEKKNIDWQYM